MAARQSPHVCDFRGCGKAFSKEMTDRTQAEDRNRQDVWWNIVKGERSSLSSARKSCSTWINGISSNPSTNTWQLTVHLLFSEVVNRLNKTRERRKQKEVKGTETKSRDLCVRAPSVNLGWVTERGVCYCSTIIGRQKQTQKRKRKMTKIYECMRLLHISPNQNQVCHLVIIIIIYINITTWVARLPSQNGKIIMITLSRKGEETSSLPRRATVDRNLPMQTLLKKHWWCHKLRQSSVC